MKKILLSLTLLVLSLTFITNSVSAKIYVNIKNNEISLNGKDYESIKSYDSLNEFLVDYNSEKLPDIYLTNFLFDGVSSVKSPDLDDYIEKNSNDISIKTLKINVLNIKTTGDIELTGDAKGLMVAINTNGLKENINLILNNVKIDTDSKKTPAIYVYNKDINYTDCKVTIKTENNTKNYIEGGKFKKVSLMPKNELSNYLSYYSESAKTNYEKYTSYYGIYNKDEVEKILFAKVSADSEDLQDGDPYYFYKASGAISSDIDLYFEGDGYLKVTSKNKEGIETKGNLIFSGGTGDYEIVAKDDCLNTTTSKRNGANIRNDIIIDVNSLVAVVSDEGDEGDAIDSNGSLTINGGKIYAFAHSSSGDAGLDSEDGTYINGGEVIATGNMVDEISNESKQKYIYVKFNDIIKKNTLIVIKDQNDEIIMAFNTKKDISNLIYSNKDLDYKSFKIYKGGTILGEESNGLYTKINNYENGDEIIFSEVNSKQEVKQIRKSNFIRNLLIGEVSLLLFVVLFMVINKKKTVRD